MMKNKNPKQQRKSWFNAEHEKSIRLMGEEYILSDDILFRVKISEFGLMILFLVCSSCFVINGGFYKYDNMLLFYMFIISGFLGGVCFLCAAYKNFSFPVAKILLRNVNVILVFFMAILNLVIDIINPTKLDYLYDLLYLGCTIMCCFLDAFKAKDRVIVLFLNFLFVMATVFHIMERVVGSVDVGIVLVKYGEDLSIEKRSFKRGIYLQILTVSMNGIFQLVFDKKSEKLMWAVGNLYRETGTTSKGKRNKKYVRNRSKDIEESKPNNKERESELTCI